MSGRLAFRRWLREALRGTQKGLVMSSAMAIGEIMIMNVTPVFIFVRVLSIQRGQTKALQAQWRSQVIESTFYLSVRFIYMI